MAAPRQAAGTGAKKNKGTRGGRPEPQPAPAQARQAQAKQAQARQAQRPTQAQRARERKAGAAAAPPAEPGIKIPPLWFQLVTWVLAIAGLGVSTYLTITHYDSSIPLACSDTGTINCALVTHSAESVVFGVFPVAVLGLAFYVFMAAATSPWAWRLKFPALTWIRIASVVVGIGFVLYLVYTELFTLDAICLWCTSVHALTFLLFVLIVGGAAAGYGFRERENY
jgi:uncharacterized membrane protein